MAVRDCQDNAVIFMGHIMRVINQQVSIQKLLNVMKTNCVNYGTKECVITIDYKMKLDPIYYREKTVDHYGQRGMSWHGYMIQYYVIKYSGRTSTPMLKQILP